MVPRTPPEDFTGARAGRFRDRLVSEAARLAAPLSSGAADAMLEHYTMLRRWGSRMNLTGLRDEEAILRRHFLEPIAAADLFPGAGRLVDIGSGSGFPAIPLKVLRPELDLVLVESSERKSAFLWSVIQALRLGNSRVETRRIRRRSDLADLLPCRYLTFRAVRGLELLGGDPPALLEREGRAILFVSMKEAARIAKSVPAGLRFLESRPLLPDADSCLVVLGPT
ncbi:MAG TPA: 16S rRNA (guanine(527)-N(7))-methyltransferase RsmG [Candidatus Polarisedimenticolia bacterium]|nr:16S rRNA (guanine(527)-N(7))-methyltransferase RsmG [Candidatus Polarisedimenticolia bacterium]